jgi:hypothetical protein
VGIEEPELYQHPSRQRHLASILWQLANGQIPGVADQTQVIYCTHSPLFVGLDRFDQIRVVRKVHHAPEMPKKTCVLSRTLNEVAERIGQLEGKAEGTYTGETLRPRLTALLDHWISAIARRKADFPEPFAPTRAVRSSHSMVSSRMLREIFGSHRFDHHARLTSKFERNHGKSN